jgi:hypothetical protein
VQKLLSCELVDMNVRAYESLVLLHSCTHSADLKHLKVNLLQRHSAYRHGPPAVRPTRRGLIARDSARYILRRGLRRVL